MRTLPSSLRTSLLISWKPIVSNSRTMATASSAAGSHTTLDGPEHYLPLEVKKSRFLAYAWPISTAEEAMQKINERSDLSASHNCFAFKCGDAYRSSDDGEPGGTAGRPILAAIEGEGLDYVCVLVVRHFGGIKLGTGGLVRAYGQAARDVLKQAPKMEIKAKQMLRFIVPYDLLGVVYQAIQAQGAEKMEENFEGGGVVLLTAVTADKAGLLEESIKNATSGRVAAEIV